MAVRCSDSNEAIGVDLKRDVDFDLASRRQLQRAKGKFPEQCVVCLHLQLPLKDANGDELLLVSTRDKGSRSLRGDWGILFNNDFSEALDCSEPERQRSDVEKDLLSSPLVTETRSIDGCPHRDDEVGIDSGIGLAPKESPNGLSDRGDSGASPHQDNAIDQMSSSLRLLEDGVTDFDAPLYQGGDQLIEPISR